MYIHPEFQFPHPFTPEKTLFSNAHAFRVLYAPSETQCSRSPWTQFTPFFYRVLLLTLEYTLSISILKVISKLYSLCVGICSGVLTHACEEARGQPWYHLQSQHLHSLRQGLSVAGSLHSVFLPLPP